MEPCRTGSIVVSLRGRDKDGIFAVIGTVETAEGKQFLLVSDGKHHPLENPKKKNPIHLQTMCASEDSLVTALEEGTLTNRHLVAILKEAQFQA